MKSLFCILSLIGCFAAHSEATPKKGAEFNVPGVGFVRIRHEVVGEPIGQPERVEVFVTCEKSKASIKAAVFRMCIYQGHTYEVGPKILTIKMFYGRVEPKTGDVVCDQFDMKNLRLTDYCSTL